ncbi:hypothetical protein [Streptomyces sp. NPDC046727]|uniref:hypothetical protein n=1 Tax=Streptomyces sp. NPDC046727 TaxID=3155373 RepID=UPI0033DAC71D
MRKLVLVHGRSQQHKDAKGLKQEWLDSLHAGLRAAGITTEIADADVAFPYYGDTLDQLSDHPQGPAVDVVVAGVGDADEAEKEFIGSVVAEAVDRNGVSEAQIRAEAGADVIERGPLNWPWVLAALRALDRLPGIGGASIALTTHDVYMYLRNIGVQRVIDQGLRSAVQPGEETVVVSHSLGTVVAYNVLAREAAQAGWRVPSFVTLGSPLGVRAIVDRLAPITHPERVGPWFNAFDVRDTVALRPLDAVHFPVTPSVENYGGVHNPTPNRHGISGYLGDPTVARRIHSALTA